MEWSAHFGEDDDDDNDVCWHLTALPSKGLILFQIFSSNCPHSGQVTLPTPFMMGMCEVTLIGSPMSQSRVRGNAERWGQEEDGKSC